MRPALRLLPHLWALAAGTAVAVQVQASPFGNRPIVDERMYVEWARRIAGGELMGGDVFFFDPLWAYVLALLLVVTKGSLLACRLFGVALFAGTVELVYRTAARLFGSERLALGAAACTALYGPLAFASGFLLKEPLTIHLVAWAAFLMVHVEGRRWVLPGLLFGLLALLRGNFLLVSPLVFIAARRQAGWAALGLALPLALCLSHNLAYGQFVVTTAHGGANFWLGNNPESSGTYEAPAFIVARPASELSGFKAEAEARVGRPLTHAESSRYWLGQGLRFWAEHPLDALGLLFRKTRLMLHDYEVPDNYALTCFRGWFAPALWLAPLSWGVLFGLALLGMVHAWRSQPLARPVVLFAVLYGASVMVFFVFDRYRVPLAPLLCLFAAVGVSRLRHVRWEAVLLAAGLLLAWVPTAVSSQRAWHEAQCLGTAGLQLQHDGDPSAERWLDEATRLAPERWPVEAQRRMDVRPSP